MSGRTTAIVILGAAVWADGPSPTLARRTREGARLFHAGAGEVVVCCGGLGLHPPTEAKAMATMLLSDGVPGDAIVLEDQSTNTAQNLGYAADLLAARNIRDVVIVSDRYHLPRACLIARRLGLRAKGAAPSMPGRVWPQLRGWLREGPNYLAYLLRLRR